jgi:hypothetical protein
VKLKRDWKIKSDAERAAELEALRNWDRTPLVKEQLTLYGALIDQALLQPTASRGDWAYVSVYDLETWSRGMSDALTLIQRLERQRGEG